MDQRLVTEPGSHPQASYCAQRAPMPWLFDEDERGPSDALELQFEAVSHLPPDEQRVVIEVLEGLIIKYQARRWGTARTAAAK